MMPICPRTHRAVLYSAHVRFLETCVEQSACCAGYVGFSDIYFNPNNSGNPDSAYTLANVPLNSSGVATYSTNDGDSTTILAGEKAALLLWSG